MPPRGFCVAVESLNDALFWLTIEGSGPEHEAQIWFSTYGLPQEQVTKVEAQWNGELERILRYLKEPKSQIKGKIMKTTLAFAKNVVIAMVLVVAVAAAQEMQAPKPGPEMEA